MDDLISRQEAIDAINALHEKPNAWLDSAVDAVMTLPSAQSESCDGCMWEDTFGYGKCYRCKRAFNDMYEVKDDE